MRRRTFEEMITYFNQTVSEMDIDRKYKMTLLGIVTALLQKHDEDVAQIVMCKDCMHHIDGFFCRQANHHTSDKDCCASVFGAERRKE